MARILTDTQAAPVSHGLAQSGLLQLVGGESSVRSERVRTFVVETALSAVADAFALDGAALVTQPVSQSVSKPVSHDRRNDRQADGGEVAPTFLAAQLPPGWSMETPELFEIYGNLWRVLQKETPNVTSSLIGGRLSGSVPRLPAPVPQQWQLQVGQHWVLLSRVADGDQPVATVAIRKSSFSDAEAEAFGEVIGSIVAACSDSEAKAVARHHIRTGTSASLKSEGDDVLAEVRADWELVGSTSRTNGNLGRRTGLGRGPDPVTAVARAAAKACRPRCEVAFAGSSELDDVDVSIVMIRHAENGLRLGFAVRDKGDFDGAAEAVFTAAG